MNSIANRTLISGETNKLIRDKAPSEYTVDLNIFPDGIAAVGTAHFLWDGAVEALAEADEELDDDEVSRLFERFESLRESAIVDEIRRACGVEITNSVQRD